MLLLGLALPLVVRAMVADHDGVGAGIGLLRGLIEAHGVASVAGVVGTRDPEGAIWPEELAQDVIAEFFDDSGDEG